MSDSETIELAALGRPFELGMLYDCRRDLLIPGITLWDAELLKKHINVSKRPNTDFKIIASDSSEAKSEALNVSASLEASFLGGLVSVKGSASFLNNKKKSQRQSRVSLQYRTTTHFEQLTMDHLGPGNVKHSNVITEGSATHVVTAILYGAQAFFVFDREFSTSESYQDIQGNLQAVIKKIPCISIEGQASLKMSEEEKSEANRFNCTFHGDFALKKNPVTFEDAIKVYADLPSMLEDNRDHAVPMNVWLYPLRNLDSAAAQLVRQINVSLVRRTQRILDGLDNTDIICQDMMKEDMAIKFPEIKAKLTKFRDLCLEYKLVFQKGLGNILPKIRGGGMEEELIEMLTSKERSPFQNDLMSAYLDDRAREINVVSSYLHIMKEVQVVYSSSELDGIVLDQANNYVVCFAFSSLRDKDDFELDLEKYLQEDFKGDSSLIPYDLNAAKKSAAEKWFRSGKVTAQTRQTIQLFLDFKESNKERENLAFCIASIPNKLITACSIHIYERGILLNSQYELPSKPGVPIIKSLEHDCVHLQIISSQLGVNSVASYQVLYQAKGTDTEWTEINTDAITNQVTIRRLLPYKEYRFSCRAVCKPGVSLCSDWTEYYRTSPCSPPGPPTEKCIDSQSIRVNWDIPTVIGVDVAVIGYVVEFRTNTMDEDNTLWHTTKTTTRDCTLEGLQANTSYSIRVSATCGEAGKSLPSPETMLTTIGVSDVIKRNQSTGANSEKFIKQSTRVVKDSLLIYRLNLEKKLVIKESFDQYTFGRKVEQGNNKVILLLGATGAGKTTLVNVMINAILGVKWEEGHRFKLIHEVTNRSQAESQTVIVTSYELYNQPGFQIPYSLTIIDTPGFGDTRGMAYDEQLTQMLKDFLCNPLGIDHIDAVCFVVQAALVRLSPSQRYIFDSILSIFGKDVAENILMLVTFADGKDIPVLEAIKAADLPCKKNKKGFPTHFKFSNAIVFENNVTESSSEDDDEDNDGDDKIDCPQQWRSTFKEIKKFFKALESIESKDLTLTKKVLEERELLKKTMTRLIPQITAGLSKLSEIKSLKACLENEQENMKLNESFETEIKVLMVKRSKLSEGFATNCKVCNFTCHTSCFLPNEDDIKSCAVMNKDGNCIVCPGKCSFSDHDREKAVLTYETKTEKKTIQELKDNFMKAYGKFMSTKDILDKLDVEFQLIEDALMNLIKQSSDCLKRLNEIALNPNSLSTMEYMEILIRTEEDQRTPGFEDRIVGLKKMKEESEILDKIARGEDILPKEKKFMKDKEERRQAVLKKSSPANVA
ncbi:uncharacterized protein LOC105008545 [Esox lucius]|uniref:Fibronectin type-III domain-containing protein n=2 Tax=Esox lucius TaxID=8010 RepID=A0A3P8XIW7_ESOLU|nr:uncharacterized protein LOC105008545 [Esox lucius]XP_019904205.2 uncharacterized protein LOC105008545 [Esox lucius]XP_019904206.2 uncharacterized protein LOC105008545 [Esox lucius]